MPKRIAYVGEFPFPRGAASSIRVLGIGRILSECGYEVSFHGQSLEKENFGEASGRFEKFEYNNLVLKDGNILKRLFNRLLAGYRTIKVFESLKPDIIILAGGYSRYLIPLLAYSRKHKIKIIVDVVEWSEYSHLPGGKHGFVAFDVHFALTRLMKKCDGIIVISSFLEKYFLQLGKKVIRLPILIDKEKTLAKPEDNASFDPDYLNLIYAGIPGQKDLIDRVIYGLDYLVKNGVKVRLHLVGPSKGSLEPLLGEKSSLLSNLDDALIFHGKVKQENVSLLLRNADFSVLIRPNLRYANAGFPTKFVESLCVGVPVICNLTSDIGMYLKDGENGFVMKDDTMESFIECVKKASMLSIEEKRRMKLAATTEANDSFDFRGFIGPVRSFFLEIS